MKIQKVSILKGAYKKPNLKILPKSIKNVAGVYFLFDKEMTLLYIGRTNTLRNRLCNHLSKRNKSRYDGKGDHYPNTSRLPLGIVKYYSFIPIKDGYTRATTEIILIHFLKPTYNFSHITKRLPRKNP